MPRFFYLAKKSPTETLKGVIVAETRAAAFQKLSAMGCFPVSVEEETGGGTANWKTALSFGGSVGLKDLTDFTRQLADLLEGGLTIARALEILQGQTVHKKLKATIGDVRECCVGGNPFSSALARHPAVFSDLYVNIVRSGETVGALETVLRKLSTYNEKQLEIRTKVGSALAYPAMMALVGVGTIAVLMTFVIPKMVSMFEELGQALPLPTQLLLWTSRLFSHYWWLLALLIVALGSAFKNYHRTEAGREVCDRLLLELPIVGTLMRKADMARFSRTLATLLQNGVPMLEALRITADTLSNTALSKELARSYDSVKEGASLSQGLSGCPWVPVAAISIIEVGEESGSVEKSLLKLSENYEREVDEVIKVAMSVLEPALILGFGLIVGFIVIAMILPIFEIDFLVR